MEITSVPHDEYDNLTTLNQAFDELKGLGFKDMSWKNDSCPRLGVYQEVNGQERYINLWIDYKDPYLRENEGWTEFMVEYREVSEPDQPERIRYVTPHNYAEAVYYAKEYFRDFKEMIYMEKTDDGIHP